MNSPIEGRWKENPTGRTCDRRKGANRIRHDGGMADPSCAPRGDIESRNRLVQENLGLVVPVARQYTHRGLSMDDLVGEGNLGLIRAAATYDPAVGTRFSTYATYWIREAIQAALANTAATIRIPVNVSRLLQRWRVTERRLSQASGRSPTFEEVATAMELDRPARRLMAQAHRVARLQRANVDRADDPRATWLMLDGRLTAEEALTAEEDREWIARRLERLEGAERMIVSLRYGLWGEPPMSFEQIGSRLGLTIAAVQKTISATIRKLGRHPDAEMPGRERGPCPAGRLKVG